MRTIALLLLALPSVAAQHKCWVDLDLLFVIDGSLSIKEKSWSTDMDAMRTIANNFTFSCQHVDFQQSAEMGIIQFSTKVNVEQHLTCDKPAFMSSVSSMTQMKDYTYTGNALKAAHAEFQANGRATSTKVLVMITDGVPCTDAHHDTCYDKAPVPTPDPEQAAKAMNYSKTMKAEGVVFITIAVGKFGTEGMKFMDEVSSQPSSKYVFNPTSWDQLPALITEIVTDICPTPVPTLPPKCSVDLDLLFLLDSSKSIKPDGWQVDLTATKQMAGQFNFGCSDDPKVGGAEAEMGIIEFATQTTVAQQLTCDKKTFLASLAGLKQPCISGDSTCHGWTYTGDAMEQAHTIFTTKSRPNSTRLTITITDGVPCTPDSPMSGDQTCRSIIPDPVPDVAQAAKATKFATTMMNDGVTMVTIAVGDFAGHGTKFIHSISSKPAEKYVFNPSSWTDLPALIQSILDSICPPSF